jgi:DNA helicase-2/ATP-dependent DNA helicase PcrA
MTAPYLAKLNADQRRAVEHGGEAFAEAGPLLIIAGAGSGKTNTLAHRVAHLIVNGIDPRRILLLTFSRRAAAEMARRVERITAQVFAAQVLTANVTGARAAVTTDALSWSGTFHAIGARLLREYAAQIGLDRSFTIHDREDSADLVNLIRHDLGFSRTEQRFPAKGTCLAIHSRAVNAELPLDEVLGGVRYDEAFRVLDDRPGWPEAARRVHLNTSLRGAITTWTCGLPPSSVSSST